MLNKTRNHGIFAFLPVLEEKQFALYHYDAIRAILVDFLCGFQIFPLNS